MPVTKQVIKRVKQAKVKASRNKHYNSHMKSMIKLVMGYIQKGESDKATKILPKVVSSIDTCAKKNLIHENNAARKKAGINRALSSVGKVALKATKKEKGEMKKEVEEVKEEVKKEADEKAE